MLEAIIKTFIRLSVDCLGRHPMILHRLVSEYLDDDASECIQRKVNPQR